MTFSICPRCRRTDNTWRFLECDCQTRDDDTTEEAMNDYHGA